jgi:tetratricopeptide (TPR) repeat protein
LRNKLDIRFYFLASLFVLALLMPAFAQISFDTPAGIDNDLKSVAALIKIGEFNRAIAYLDRLKMSNANDPRINDLYKMAFKEGKLYQKLEEMIRQQLSQNPRNSLLISELGEARYLQEDMTGADTLWNYALEIGKLDEATYRYVADMKLRYGLYDSAIDAYLRGRRNLNSPYIFSIELAGIYEAQHDYPKAVDEYLLQIKQAPDKLGFISTQIRGLLEDPDDRQQIIRTLETRLKESPGQFELYEILADLYMKQNQTDKALECYRTLGAKQNDDGQSLVRFATRANDSKAYASAVSAVDEYLRLSKKGMLKEIAISTKAKALMSLGRNEEALSIYTNLSQSAIDYRIKDEAGFYCGQIYAKDKSNCDSAIYYWNTLLRSARDQSIQNNTQIEMAICYLKKDQYSQAEDLLNQVLSNKTPDDGVERAKFLLGDLYFFKGDIKKAGDLFKEVVMLYPQGEYSNDALTRMDVIANSGDDITAGKYLSSFSEAMKYVEIDQPLEAGKILADTAFTQSPIAEQAAFYAAMAFSRGNDLQTAISFYNKYVDRYPDGLYTDRAYLQLGDLYMQNPATYSSAKAAYNKILESYPASPVTEIARQKLLQLQSPGKIG